MSKITATFLCPACGQRVPYSDGSIGGNWWLAHVQRCGILGRWGGSAVDDMHCACGFQLYKLSFEDVCDHYNSHTAADWQKIMTRNVLESM